MLEDKTFLKQYGDSIVILVPRGVLNDSSFPFKVEKTIKNGKEVLEGLEINFKIDVENKRLVIEQ